MALVPYTKLLGLRFSTMRATLDAGANAGQNTKSVPGAEWQT
jgi:hypothetical protein